MSLSTRFVNRNLVKKAKRFIHSEPSRVEYEVDIDYNRGHDPVMWKTVHSSKKRFESPKNPTEHYRRVTDREKELYKEETKNLPPTDEYKKEFYLRSHEPDEYKKIRDHRSTNEEWNKSRHILAKFKSPDLPSRMDEDNEADLKDDLNLKEGQIALMHSPHGGHTRLFVHNWPLAYPGHVSKEHYKQGITEVRNAHISHRSIDEKGRLNFHLKDPDGNESTFHVDSDAIHYKHLNMHHSEESFLDISHEGAISSLLKRGKKTVPEVKNNKYELPEKFKKWYNHRKTDVRRYDPLRDGVIHHTVPPSSTGEIDPFAPLKDEDPWAEGHNLIGRYPHTGYKIPDPDEIRSKLKLKEDEIGILHRDHDAIVIDHKGRHKTGYLPKEHRLPPGHVEVRKVKFIHQIGNTKEGPRTYRLSDPDSESQTTLTSRF